MKQTNKKRAYSITFEALIKEYENGHRSTEKIIKQMITDNDSSMKQIAEIIGTTPQNLTQRLQNDKFTQSELYAIGRIFGYEYSFKFERTNEITGITETIN